jgi:hypothetical protein
MKSLLVKAATVALALTASGAAFADNNFGVGIKAGTLGIGLEGTWRPLPYLDVRLGANSYDYEADGSQAGVNYDATLNLDTYYATANFRFPASPMRISAGIYSNGNELNLQSAEIGDVMIGDVLYSSAEVGSLSSTTSFSGTAPYLGFGFDFTVLGKVGLNMDFGVLWQGEPTVTMNADGLVSGLSAFQAELEKERLELEDEVSDYKAWPVVSLGFVFNF